MSETAAHLVDRVFPRAPVRQWVLSMPKQVRYYLGRRGKLRRRVLKIFLQEVFRLTRRKAGLGDSGTTGCGAVSVVQRFGGALNLNVHFHCLVLDGVFLRPGIGGPGRVARESRLWQLGV